MPARLDLTGKRYGKLIALEISGFDKWGAALWRCQCDCGSETVTRGTNITSGKSVSCGCGVRIAAVKSQTTHGKSKTVIYRAWRAMLGRCYHKKSENYKNYGGRGIIVCDRWRTKFENFDDDMGKSWFEGAELDRKDNNGNYEPSNCRWTTKKVQQSNKRNNHRLTINGKTLTIAQWGDESGLKPNTILTRVRRGWAEHRILEIANK